MTRPKPKPMPTDEFDQEAFEDALIHSLAEDMRTGLHRDCPPDGMHCTMSEIDSITEGLVKDCSGIVTETLARLDERLRANKEIDSEDRPHLDLVAAFLFSLMFNEIVTDRTDLQEIIETGRKRIGLRQKPIGVIAA